MKYRIAEKFKSIQGEGVYSGTPMAFIRFVGCSVSKKICSACDTDYEEEVAWRGGGEFEPDDLTVWARPMSHVCLTGGEPLDQDLSDLFEALAYQADPDGTGYDYPRPRVHIETSGTVNLPQLLMDCREKLTTWICVSPKPGFKEDVVMSADEVKVIVPGLGSLRHGNVINRLKVLGQDEHGGVIHEDVTWPTIDDALRWARAGKTVFLQPRNTRNEIDPINMKLCMDLVIQHPELRLSTQLHKILKVS